MIRRGRTLSIVACLAIGVGGVFLIRTEGSKAQQARLYLEYLREGEDLIQSKNYVNAEKIYLKAVEIDPQEEFAYRQLEKIYTQCQQFDAARAIIERFEAQALTTNQVKSSESVAVAKTEKQSEIIQKEIQPTVETQKTQEETTASTEEKWKVNLLQSKHKCFLLMEEMPL